MIVREELNEASLAVYLRTCPNCGGLISDRRLLSGLPCTKCLPNELTEVVERGRIFETVRRAGTMKYYEELEKIRSTYSELAEVFTKALGSEPWGIQKLWLMRLSKKSSFAMLAPTGVGKTTVGLLAAVYFTMKGGKSYILVPTTVLVKQAEKILDRFLSKIGFTAIVVPIHSKLSKSEKARREEVVERGDFDILITTSRYLMKNFDKLKNLRFSYVFVDDVDAVMRGSRAIEMILTLMGFSDEDIAKGIELIKLRREIAYRGLKEDLLEKLRKLEKELEEKSKHINSILVVASATGTPRGIRSRLFRELLGFDVGARPELIRNVIDAYVIPSKKLEEEIVELVEKLGSGGLIYIPADKGIEYANYLVSYLKDVGVRAEALHSKKTGALDRFATGDEIDVLVGVATYYGVLVRGIDIPERIRYAIFVGVPRHKVKLEVEKLDVRDVLRLLPLLVSSVRSEDTRDRLEIYLTKLVRAVRRAGSLVIDRFGEILRGEREPETYVEKVFVEALNLVRELMRDPEIVNSLKRNPEVAVVEEGELYVLIPDSPTYIQASGRTSRLYLGGVSRGISIVIVDDYRLLRGLERRLSFIIDDFKFSNYRDIYEKLPEILREVDGDRELIRMIREGSIPVEELSKLKRLEFKTSLLIVESPNKARTIAKFFGRPSAKEYGRLRVYEVSIGNQTILITSSGGHIYELITNVGDLARNIDRWIELHGVMIKNGRYLPLYSTIKRCQSCGRQFTDEGINVCPFCSSTRVVDSIDVISAIRDVAMEVDEILVGTDPDTEGEKIAYDLISVVTPLNSNVRRIEFHEVTRRALVNSIRNPRDVNINLVKAQLVRRIEDRWIGFSLSKLLQEDFWPVFCREVVPQLPDIFRKKTVERKTARERYQGLCDEHPKAYRNLSAGRVQTPVLGWIIENNRKYRETRKKALAISIEEAGIEFTVDLPEELRKINDGDIESIDVVVENVEEDVVTLKPEPPFTTDSILSELSSRYGIPVAKSMDILQELFESGFITYHRTDSTRVSDVGIRVAEEYLKQVEGEKYRELLRPRTWSEGGAHEAIRPTRPIDAETLRRLVEEGVIEPVIKLQKIHYIVYDAIFRRFIASQLCEAEIVTAGVKYRILLKLKDDRVVNIGPNSINIYTSIIREGFLKYDRKITVRKTVAPGIYRAVYRLFYRSDVLPHTESSLVRKMRETGIGRPSTYSKIVETILKRGYATRAGKTGFIVPKRLGVEVFKYLVSRFENLVSEERTRALEKKMDLVEQGLDNYERVISLLYSDLVDMGLVRFERQ